MIRLITTAVLCLGVTHAVAQEAYPTRPIRLVVPYSAGGASDVMARYYGDRLGAILQQPIIIENQPAAAGTNAYMSVARAVPDGYTLTYGTSSIAVNAALRRKSPYDPIRDFAPVAPLLVVQNVLVVPASLSAQSVKELV